MPEIVKLAYLGSVAQYRMSLLLRVSTHERLLLPHPQGRCLSQLLRMLDILAQVIESTYFPRVRVLEMSWRVR